MCAPERPLFFWHQGFPSRSSIVRPDQRDNAQYRYSDVKQPRRDDRYIVIASVSEAIHAKAGKREWIASSLSLLAMTSGNDAKIRARDPAARCARVVACTLRLRRGRGEGRVLAAPMARLQTKNAGGSHHRFSQSSGLPRAMVLTVSFGLSPGTGLSCPRRPAELLLTNLTPASGRQDHTTSPSAKVPLVRAKLALRAPASIASRTHVS